MTTQDTVSKGESNMAELALQAEIRAAEIVNLNQWIVAVDKVNSENQTVYEVDRN
jgi:hypothetical protein